MILRNARLGDLESVTALENLCFPPAEAASRESLRGRLAFAPDCFYVLEEDGNILSMVNGFATDDPNLEDDMYADFDQHNSNGAWLMLFGVDTHPDRRGEGLASRLLEHVCNAARAMGREGIVLTCKEELIPFYARFGFENEGKSPSVHGGVVWYQMRKKLS